MKNTTIQVKIDNFEGPLDLLIHLIEKKQMKITEINISQIIDDYLIYIKQQKNENLKIKVEFLIMATDLIEIKAYSILNKEKKDEKIEDLERKLMEYKLFKEISELFSEYENEYNVPYKRTGTKNIETALIEYDISKLTLETLLNSFKALLEEEDKEKLILNLEEDYSTEDAVDEINEIMITENRISFSTLLKNKFTKSRIVSLFLCILEMFKSGYIDIVSDEKEFYIQKLSS
ncbi:segregation/condensation protein A [Leptotrichia sp. OH3620_COT-345]|uniref:segregation and condensation protein A n=1 Tax=Leptotrichia sp. OH3620_COT-345 TaxID=2491048 RepID=UPI000F64D353|nr:ScpA family protein [Leptotrichia sp. OH3620_COT-345]RRD40911.1 segregation/condensation protein A [Leptotrichia sp. OH3620_COT-345]